MSNDELRSSNSEHKGDINRMKDALDLFRTLINWKKKNYINIKNKNESFQLVEESLLFDKVSIILFLNKEDLFEEKFRRSSLKTCFSDYTETNSAEEAKKFIAYKFLECDRSNTNYSSVAKLQNRDIYWHYTFALDRKNIETVIISVKDRIMKCKLHIYICILHSFIILYYFLIFKSW
jgi:hypothetical protein